MLQIFSSKSIAEIYNFFIDKENKENVAKRYSNENSKYYHASQAGMCVRKHWYSVNGTPITNPPNKQSLRKMRLGTVVHNDFENAFSLFQKEKEKSIKEKENNINTNKDLLSSIRTIRTEQEVRIPEFNVRGFYDAVFVMENDEVYLCDIKTIHAYGYKLKFGRSPTDFSIHHDLQVATYGLAVQEEYGRLDGMFLYYYHKDDSRVKVKEVPLAMLGRAFWYWRNTYEAVNDHALPPPRNRNEGSPRYTWECGYCQFYTTCYEGDTQ